MPSFGAEPDSLAGSARAFVLVTDFANADSSNKINMIGAGFQYTQRVQMPGSGLVVPPMTIVTLIDVPAKYVQTEFTLVLTLKNAAGEPVQVPTRIPGETQAVRLSHIASAKRSNDLPADLGGRIQFVMNLATGLPLEPAQAYTWELQIDGHTNPNWRATFYVRPDPRAPTLG
jgi:hypothetical protein